MIGERRKPLFVGFEDSSIACVSWILLLHRSLQKESDLVFEVDYAKAFWNSRYVAALPPPAFAGRRVLLLLLLV